MRLFHSQFSYFAAILAISTFLSSPVEAQSETFEFTIDAVERPVFEIAIDMRNVQPFEARKIDSLEKQNCATSGVQTRLEVALVKPYVEVALDLATALGMNISSDLINRTVLRSVSNDTYFLAYDVMSNKSAFLSRTLVGFDYDIEPASIDNSTSSQARFLARVCEYNAMDMPAHLLLWKNSWGRSNGYADRLELQYTTITQNFFGGMVVPNSPSLLTQRGNVALIMLDGGPREFRQAFKAVHDYWVVVSSGRQYSWRDYLFLRDYARSHNMVLEEVAVKTDDLLIKPVSVQALEQRLDYVANLLIQDLSEAVDLTNSMVEDVLPLEKFLSDLEPQETGPIIDHLPFDSVRGEVYAAWLDAASILSAKVAPQTPNDEVRAQYFAATAKLFMPCTSAIIDGFEFQLQTLSNLKRAMTNLSDRYWVGEYRVEFGTPVELEFQNGCIVKATFDLEDQFMELQGERMTAQDLGLIVDLIGFTQERDKYFSRVGGHNLSAGNARFILSNLQRSQSITYLLKRRLVPRMFQAFANRVIAAGDPFNPDDVFLPGSVVEDGTRILLFTNERTEFELSATRRAIIGRPLNTVQVSISAGSYVISDFFRAWRRADRQGQSVAVSVGGKNFSFCRPSLPEIEIFDSGAEATVTLQFPDLCQGDAPGAFPFSDVYQALTAECNDPGMPSCRLPFVHNLAQNAADFVASEVGSSLIVSFND